MNDNTSASARRINSFVRGKKINFYVDGHPTSAYQGETLHAALIAAGYRQLRNSKENHPRGIYCGMGVCFECLVTVNGRPSQQACMTRVENGMEVELSES